MIDTYKKNLKTGVYSLDYFNESIFVIEEDQNVTLIDFNSNKGLIKIELEKNSKLDFYGLYNISGNFGVEINGKGDKSLSNINILNLSKENNLNISAIANINSDNSVTDIHIISLCGENGKIKINSGVNIPVGTFGCNGNILQENVFLGDNGKIIGVPALNIETSEAKANHALKIEKISEKDLFYLESRGIDKDTATRLIFESKINILCSDIMYNFGNQIEELIFKFLK